jgi:hypothetical protein
MKSKKVRYVIVNDGYDTEAADAGAGAETETEIEDEIDLRLECLKLAIAFSKGAKESAPISVAEEFVSFVLKKPPVSPTGGEEEDGRTSP